MRRIRVAGANSAAAVPRTGMTPPLLKRVRWGNVGIGVAALGVLALVVAWPLLSPAAPALPPERPVAAAPSPTPTAPDGADAGAAPPERDRTEAQLSAPGRASRRREPAVARRADRRRRPAPRAVERPAATPRVRAKRPHAAPRASPSGPRP